MAQRYEIIALAARYAVPVIYPWREFAEAGGLMSYGPDLAERRADLAADDRRYRSIADAERLFDRASL